MSKNQIMEKVLQIVEEEIESSRREFVAKKEDERKEFWSGALMQAREILERLNDEIKIT